MVRAPRGRLDHRVERALELIGQTFARHPARDDRRRSSRLGRQRFSRPNRVVARGVASHGGVDLLQDVAARAVIPEPLLPTLDEPPRVSRDALGEPQALEMLEARNEQGLVDAPARCARAGLHEAVGPAALELPVERRKPLLGDLALLRPPHIPFRPRSELLGRQLLGAPAHAARDVAPVNPQLAPVAVDAANDDVRVRVAGVEVVDRRPLHFAPEVPLERRHQAPHVDGEVELRTVLGRDDEPKLVLLAGTRLLEDPRANRPLRVVEHGPSSRPSRRRRARCSARARRPPWRRSAPCAAGAP